MDEFFQKYGWLIVGGLAVAAVIALVVIMNGTIGTSVNGFLSDFGNKVTNVLGSSGI